MCQLSPPVTFQRNGTCSWYELYQSWVIYQYIFHIYIIYHIIIRAYHWRCGQSMSCPILNLIRPFQTTWLTAFLKWVPVPITFLLSDNQIRKSTCQLIAPVTCTLPPLKPIFSSLCYNAALLLTFKHRLFLAIDKMSGKGWMDNSYDHLSSFKCEYTPKCTKCICHIARICTNSTFITNFCCLIYSLYMMIPFI